MALVTETFDDIFRQRTPESSLNFRTNVATESEVDEKWTKFAERPDDSALAPLDNVYHTSFGGIRRGEQYISACCLL